MEFWKRAEHAAPVMGEGEPMLAARGREWLGVAMEGGGEAEEVAAAPAGGGPSSLARVVLR